jgi:C-terminal processing protease CtpA/Prc
VLTGGLHDNCRALVAGDRSFGKGLIQGVFGLNDGSGLIVTVAKYVALASVAHKKHTICTNCVFNTCP